MNTNQELVINAQREIAAILAKLENDTKMLVENIQVRSIDVTNLSDATKRYKQCVDIEMYRLPGHEWGETT